MENKQEKFIRIASKRTDSVLIALRRLKNCSIRSQYEYTSEQVEKITCALDEAIAEVKAAFRELPKVKPKTFSLLDEPTEQEPVEHPSEDEE